MGSGLRRNDVSTCVDLKTVLPAQAEYVGLKTVIPAQAGTHIPSASTTDSSVVWVPACAGMTYQRVLA